DQVYPDGPRKIGHAPEGAQHVGHQGAATGAELDQAERGRPSHAQPQIGAPEADQFAEHLANLRRRDEVAGGAEGIARGVIAEPGMAQGLGHVVGNRDRALDRDTPGQDFRYAHEAPWATGGRMQASHTKEIPTAIIGSERSCPMVAPSHRKPSWASGSRKNSTAKRQSP